VKDLLHVPEVRSEPQEAVEGKVTEYRIVKIQGNLGAHERVPGSVEAGLKQNYTVYILPGLKRLLIEKPNF
jgi:hypothetical protein